MKKIKTFILVVVTVTGILSGCKKSSNPNKEEPKDYSTSIKDKTWWGALTYTGQTAEYYCVHFNADHTLLWSQLAGDYDGQWDVSGEQLTIILTAPGVQITADISDDNKLSNFKDNTLDYEVNSADLLTNPDLALDNTTWKGTYFNGSSQQPLQFSFSPGSGITITFGSYPAETHVYTRSPSGAAIRFNHGGVYPFFGILTSSTLMKGSEQDSRFPWLAIKQ
jgi:hypothetical protein